MRIHSDILDTPIAHWLRNWIDSDSAQCTKTWEKHAQTRLQVDMWYISFSDTRHFWRGSTYWWKIAIKDSQLSALLFLLRRVPILDGWNLWWQWMFLVYNKEEKKQNSIFSSWHQSQDWARTKAVSCSWEMRGNSCCAWEALPHSSTALTKSWDLSGLTSQTAKSHVMTALNQQVPSCKKDIARAENHMGVTFHTSQESQNKNVLSFLH